MSAGQTKPILINTEARAHPPTLFLRSCIAASLAAKTSRFLPVPKAEGILRKSATVDAADCKDGTRGEGRPVN